MTTHKDHAKNGEPQAKESHHSKDSKAETEGGHHHHTSNPAEQAGAAISHAFRTWFRDTEADGTPILPHQVTKKYHVSSKVLGQGSFAVVKLVVDKKTGEERAMKIVAKKPLKDSNEKMLKEEINILGKVEHPNMCVQSLPSIAHTLKLTLELCTASRCTTSGKQKKACSS
jgi:Protein kinase domain